MRPPSPLKQCWSVPEIFGIIAHEKIFHYPIYFSQKPTLFKGGGGRMFCPDQKYAKCPRTFSAYCRSICADAFPACLPAEAAGTFIRSLFSSARVYFSIYLSATPLSRRATTWVLWLRPGMSNMRPFVPICAALTNFLSNYSIPQITSVAVCK